MDFGDLILYSVQLFEKNSDIRQIYQKNFKYILVDEFQDTNFIQNKWLNLLVNEKIIFVASETMINLFTAGGGAEIKNFLTFDKLFIKIVKSLSYNKIIGQQKYFRYSFNFNF